jgi:hypothetical protein
MKSTHHSPGTRKTLAYRIKVEGELNGSWSDWLDGMAITHETGSGGSDITTLTRAVVDQAALHGIRNRIRDLNLLLLSVQLIGP